MCGIVALLARQSSPWVKQYLLDGIKMLQNRGYDSCGGVLLRGGEDRWFWKAASTMECSAMELLDVAVSSVADSAWQCGMFQTRWATHGAKTDQNAHPHCEASGRFYVVHNGIITNYATIKAKLQAKGYVFQSETDTEVVVHMVADCLDGMQRRQPDQSVDMLLVWKMVVSHLEGTWSLVMCDTLHPSWLYVAKHGSPLLMSYSEDGTMLAFSSELHGIRFKTQQYHEIQDGAAFVVDEKLCLLDTEHVLAMAALTVSADMTTVLPTHPHPYEFWTEKEINEQPQSLWNALNRGGRLYVNDDGGSEWHVKLGGLERKRTILNGVQHVVLVGCGTSLYAAQFAARVFRTVTKLATVQVFDAAEFSSPDIRHLQPEEVLVVLVSQSGETKDCQRVLEWVKERSILTVGVVNVVGSWLARHTDCGIYLNAGREVGVASTKSFTSQCVVLTLLALWLGQRSKLVEWGPRVYNIADVFTRGLPGLELRATELVIKVVCQRSLFLLGRGYAHAIALEGALKLKELTCKNVEGYSGGALKHGPFAVLGADATVFLHCWQGPDWDHMLSAAEQVTSRGAQVVLLHNTDRQADLVRRFPHAELVALEATDEWSASLLSVVLYQYLAYFVARNKGLNPDQPRNLAKVVTVDG